MNFPDEADLDKDDFESSYEFHRAGHENWCWITRTKDGRWTGWSIADDLAVNSERREGKEVRIVYWNDD